MVLNEVAGMEKINEIKESSLFQESEQQLSTDYEIKSLKNSSVIDISFMHFIKKRKMRYEDLFFDNFNSIKIMTYSFSLPFISKLIKPFEQAEVIVSPSAIHMDTAEILASQGITSNFICKEKELQQRIKDGSFHLYVAKDVVQHAKIYLLKSNDGRTRCVFGSANASTRAWNSSQIENYVVCDDPSYYKILSEEYDDLRQKSTSNISIPAKEIKQDGSNIDQIPLIKEIKTALNAVVIRDLTNQDTNDELQYAFTLSKMSDNIRKILAKSKTKATKKDRGTVINCEKVKEIVKITDEIKEEKVENEITCPALELDYLNDQISINDTIQEMQPSIQEIRSDIQLWMKYIKGFEAFTGNASDLKEKAWKMLVHMFASPFFATLRYEGARYEFSTRRFPMYALYYGPSDNGKTALIKLIQKMMLNISVNALPNNYFSPRADRLMGLAFTIKGCPILIDDVEPSQWKYAGNIVKNDDKLVTQRRLNHPTFIMTANELGTIKPEISKRMLIIHVNNRLSKSIASRKDGEIKAIKKTMTNALYRCYMSDMLPLVEQMISKMAGIYNTLENDTDSIKWQPDIYNLSSKTLLNIFKRCGIKPIKEFTILTWDDFMGDSVVSERALSELRSMNHLKPEIFQANAARNELIVNLGELANKIDIAKRLKELPADMEMKECGDIISLNLKETEYYTGLNLCSKSLLSRLSKFLRK